MALTYDSDQDLTGVVGLSFTLNMVNYPFVGFYLGDAYQVVNVWGYHLNGELWANNVTDCGPMNPFGFFTVTLLADVGAQTYSILLDGVSTACTNVPFYVATDHLQFLSFYINGAYAGSPEIDDVLLFTVE